MEANDAITLMASCVNFRRKISLKNAPFHKNFQQNVCNDPDKAAQNEVRHVSPEKLAGMNLKYS